MQDLAGNVMSELNVKVRAGTKTLYDTKVSVRLDEPVSVLKKRICEKDKELEESLIEIIYCGCVMEDCNPIYTYNLFRGATVHVYKKHPIEKPSPPKAFTDADFVKLNVAFRAFTVNALYRSSLAKHTSPEEIKNIISHVPGLAEDPIALALIQRSELLVKIGDFEVVKRLTTSHPALAWAVLHLATVVHEDVMQSRFGDEHARNLVHIGSDEDIEDIDDSSPASETSSQPVSRNSSFGTITAAQLASAIQSVTNQQSQPSTSGASTSTTNTGNTLGQLMDPDELSTSLQIMREMGLDDEALNLYTLQQTNNLETAVELILNGFGVGDTFEDRV